MNRQQGGYTDLATFQDTTMQHCVYFSILFFISVSCLRCSHEPAWLKSPGCLAVVLCNRTSPPKEAGLGCPGRIPATVRCGGLRLECISEADVCGHLARFRKTAATAERKSSPGPRCFLRLRMATRRTRYKCRSLDAIKTRIQHDQINLDVSDRQANKETIPDKWGIENCTSLTTYQVIQVLTNTSDNEYRNSGKKLCSSTLLECFSNQVMDIKNSQQNFTYSVCGLFGKTCCQRFNCQKFKVSSQTQTMQQKYNGIVEEHRRKRSSQRNNRSDSGENPSHVGSSMPRRNRQNNSGMTTHETHHVVTTQIPQLLNDSLLALLKSMFPELYLTEGTDYLPAHHRTSTERHHSWTGNANRGIVSTTNDLTWSSVEGTSTQPGDPDLNRISTSASVTRDATKDDTTYSSETQTIQFDSNTDANIFTDSTSLRDTTNEITRANTAGSTTMNTNINTTNTDDITDVNILTDSTSMRDTTNDNTPAHAAESTTMKAIINTTNTGGVTDAKIEQHSATDVSTYTTIVPTGKTKDHHTTIDETTDSTMGQSTTDATSLNIATADVATADNTVVLKTNDLTTSTMIAATEALPAAVTANDVTTPTTIATDITTLNIVTGIYSTMQTSSHVAKTDVTTVSAIDITTTASVAIGATTLTTNTTTDVTHVSATDITKATSVTRTLTANTTIDITTKSIASSTNNTTQQSTAPTTPPFTELTTSTVATLPETTDFTTTDFTTVNTSIDATRNDMNIVATTTSTVATVPKTTDFTTTDFTTVNTSIDATANDMNNETATSGARSPTTVQKLDVLSTESVTDGSVIDTVTPDSRPYGVIGDTTSVYTPTFATGTVTTTNLATGTANSANNMTIQAITTDSTESNITTTEQMPITTVEHTATMSNDVTTPNLTNLLLNTDVSTSHTTINQAVDTESPSRKTTRQMSTIHVLGLGPVIRPVSTKDTTTVTFTTSHPTSTTPDSVVSDIASAVMDSGSQCSRSSGVMCFLEAANRSLQGETANITHDHLMDTCEVLMDKLQNVFISRSDHNSTKVITNYFQVLDTFLSIHLKTPSLRQNQRLDNILTKVASFVDTVMQPTTAALNFHPSIRLTLTNLDLLLFQLQPEALKERQLNMRSVAITVHDVHNLPTIDSSGNATATVTALVLTVPGAEVALLNSKTAAVVSSVVLALSAAIGGSKVSLTHTFSMAVSHPKNRTFGPVCGFQSQNESGEPIWDTKGCQLRSYTDGASSFGMVDNSQSYFNLTQENLTKPSVVCECNHTTNFAVLMQVVDFEIGETDELALSIITYIGCSVSLITQVIAITVFTCIRSLNSERVCVHRNLCISIMAAQITFIAGIKAVSNRVVCAVVAVLLHYFYTSAFMWMLVEGLHLYNMIVRVFGTERSRIVYYTCLGYGLPLLLVAISAVVDWEGYGINNSCWLSIQRSTIWAFVGPAMAIIIVNFVILAVVIRIVVTSARMDKNSDYDHIRAGIKATLLLLPLLGLTWVFGLAAVNEKLIIFQYLFAILNTLQGFFIFMLHCVFNKEVRQTLSRMREKRSLQKGEFGNTISPSARDRPSSSDSRSSSSTYVIIKEAVSSAFSRKTIQVSPADFCFTQKEKQHEIGNKKLPQKEKELCGIGNYHTKSRNLY